MKIKSFRAESVAAALKQVRDEMGGDALVLKTKKLANPLGVNRVEITACLSNGDNEQVEETLIATAEEKVVKTETKEETVAATAPIETDNKQTLERVFEKLESLERKVSNVFTQTYRDGTLTISSNLIDKLKDADFTEDNIAALIGQIQQSAWSNSEIEQQTTLRQILVGEFASVMTPDLRFESGDKVVLIGPPGAGKSSVLGKLAFHLVSQHNQKVKLSSLDNFKIGGHEEIASYADLLGIEMTDESISQPANDTVMLFDTPSLPNDTNARNKLAELIEKIAPTHRLLVFPATIRTSDLSDLFTQAISFCPTHLVMSMTDVTHRYGALLSATQIVKRQLAFTTDAPGGIGSIKSPDPDAMVRRILKTKGALCKC